MYLKHAPSFGDAGSSYILNTTPHFAISVRDIKHGPSLATGGSGSTYWCKNTRPCAGFQRCTGTLEAAVKAFPGTEQVQKHSALRRFPTLRVHPGHRRRVHPGPGARVHLGSGAPYRLCRRLTALLATVAVPPPLHPPPSASALATP